MWSSELGISRPLPGVIEQASPGRGRQIRLKNHDIQFRSTCAGSPENHEREASRAFGRRTPSCNIWLCRHITSGSESPSSHWIYAYSRLKLQWTSGRRKLSFILRDSSSTAPGLLPLSYYHREPHFTSSSWPACCAVCLMTAIVTSFSVGCVI